MKTEYLRKLADLSYRTFGKVLVVDFSEVQYLWADYADFWHWVGLTLANPDFDGDWEGWLSEGNWDYSADDGEDVHQVYLLEEGVMTLEPATWHCACGQVADGKVCEQCGAIIF